MEHPFPDLPHQVVDEGDAAHWVAENCFEGSGFSPYSMIGLAHENGVVVDADMAEYVDTYITEVKSVVQQDRLYIEQSLSGEWLNHLLKEVTPDAWYYCSETKTLYVWDLKFGWRVVEAMRNLQMAIYIGSIIAFLGNVEILRIEATIVQPRAPHPQGRIRKWHPQTEELSALFVEVNDSLVAATGNSPMCLTGEHCRDCKALAHCRAAQQAGYTAIEISGHAMIETPTPADLAAELNALLAAEEAIKYRKVALETMGTASAEKGTVIPGFGLERSYGRACWKGSTQADIDATVEALEIMTGITLFKKVPLSPAQAKKNGLDDETKKIYVETPVRGHKLVRSDATQKATEAFGAALGETT
jgi:hypothetical protein